MSRRAQSSQRNSGRRTRRNRPRRRDALALTSIHFNTGPRHQPVPDRYFCTLEVTELGHYASAAAAYQHWVFPLSAIAHPFNQVNGDAAIPNPLVAVASLSPAGLQNLLYNTTTSTGLWEQYRVHRCHYELNCQPTNGADDSIIVVSPCQSSSTPPFANILNAADSPGSKMRVCSQANPTAQNTVKGTVDIAGVLGLTRPAYEADTTNTYGTYTNLPVETVYAFVTSTTMSDAAYTASCGLHVKLLFEVEFFQRADTALLDA
jgi:hypothetical protein